MRVEQKENQKLTQEQPTLTLFFHLYMRLQESDWHVRQSIQDELTLI